MSRRHVPARLDVQAFQFRGGLSKFNKEYRIKDVHIDD
jgi:hypothetical protein